MVSWLAGRISEKTMKRKKEVHVTEQLVFEVVILVGQTFRQQFSCPYLMSKDTHAHRGARYLREIHALLETEWDILWHFQ